MIDFIKKQRTLCATALSLIGTAALTTVLPNSTGTAHMLCYCALFAATAFYCTRRAIRLLDMRLAIFSLIGGLFVALALAVGGDVGEDYHFALSIGNLARVAAVTCCLAVPIAAGLMCLFEALPRLADEGRYAALENTPLNPARWNRARTLLAVWAILLLFFLPAYLGYFPGIWGYDMHNQNYQALSGRYNAYQPLLHTLLYQLCYNVGTGVFGTGTAGVALFTGAQALLLSFCLAYTVTYVVHTLRAPFAVALASVAFYALPFHAILAVSSTKDTVFSGVFLVLLTQLVSLCMDPAGFTKSVWRMAAFAGLTALSCLLRNNMLYAFLFGAAFVVLICKTCRVRVLLLFAVSAALAVVGGKLLSGALHASDGPRNEMLNVPIQQIACAYDRHGQEWSDAERRELYRYIPEEQLAEYYPLLSDPVKLESNIGDGLPSLVGFMKVWWRLLPRYYNDYIDSFLVMTLGYWFPGETLHAHIYDGYRDEPGNEETLGYMYTGFMEDINEDVHKRSLWPAAERYYQWFAHENGHQRIPVLSLLLAPGTYCMLVFIALVALLYFKRYRLALPLALPYGVWLTLLMGPCVIIRYAYPIMASAPLFVGLLLNRTPRYALKTPEPQAQASGGSGRFGEMARFAVAGGLGFIIDYGCTYAFTSLVGMHYLVATALAFTLSVVVNYLLCAYWVFQGVDTKNAGVKAGFLLTSLVGLGLNELFMYAFVDLLHIPVMASKLIAVVLVMIWNYVSKRKVLVKKPKESEENK